MATSFTILMKEMALHCCYFMAIQRGHSFIDTLFLSWLRIFDASLWITRDLDLVQPSLIIVLPPREHSDIVEKFVENLGLHDLRIMVQDWGGPIGLGFAGRRPDLVHSVILGNTWAWPAKHSKGMSAFSKILGNGLARFLITRYNALVKWLIRAGINRTLTEPELAAYMGPFLTPESRIPTWIFAKEILKSEAYLAEVEAGLASLREKPALVVWGEADGAFRKSARLLLMKHFPNHRVCLLPEAKHFIQENAPDEICTAILESVL